MSKVDELIRNLCPNGVEYKRISEIADTNIGLATSVTKNKATTGVRLLHNSDIQANRIVVKKDEFITEDFAQKNIGKILHYHDIITVHTGDVGTSAVIEEEYAGSVGFTTITTRIKNFDDVNPYYLCHYLNSHLCKRDITKETISDRSNLNQKSFEKLVVPVPPMEAQREIVQILDKLTLLSAEFSAELSAELSARKKQYSYYLNRFFESQKDNLVPLNEVGSLTRGKRFVHKDATEEGVPCIHYGELYTYYGVYADEVKSHIREELRSKMRYAHKSDVIIVGAGENNVDIGVGVAWEGDEDVAVHDACYTFSHDQNPRYISYYLRSEMYHRQIKKYVSEGKICAISAEGIGKALIPIPSMEEQNRIVTILSKFDGLCNEISEGIPAEIEARQKQYEYYRDKVLNFRKEG